MILMIDDNLVLDESSSAIDTIRAGICLRIHKRFSVFGVAN